MCLKSQIMQLCEDYLVYVQQVYLILRKWLCYDTLLLENELFIIILFNVVLNKI